MKDAVGIRIFGMLIALGAASMLASQETPNKSTPSSQTTAFKDGWRRDVAISEVKDKNGDTLAAAAKIELWVEQDWLCARRSEAGGAVEWQVVLARAINDAAPTIETGKLGGLDIAFGKYFIRENVGRIRIFRERKVEHSPPWPKLELSEPIERRSGSAAMASKQIQLKGFESGDWFWIATGPASDRPDLWLRVEHKELRSPGYGFQGGPYIPARTFFGDHQASDEGDLFIATRSTKEVAEAALAALKLRQTLGKHPAPAIEATKWFNAPEEISLESLRGKVVMLDFWGTWCGPCVKKLPDVEAIHKKYADRGLVVIGVHSEQGAESVATFLEKEPLSFPIAVDVGKTAKSYGVNSWPTYFLIDKAGKTKWGFSSSLPSEAQLEELLR